MYFQAKVRWIVTLLLCSAASWVAAPPFAMAQSEPTGQIELTVMDQNGQPLALAVVLLLQNGKTISQERTTHSGNVTFRRWAAGAYKIIVQKPGFYAASVDVEVPAGQTLPVEVRMQPVREYREEIEVTAQPSPIDPEQMASAQSLTVSDISSIPYPTTRDYRNVLPYIPGVLADSFGQIHVAGASTQEIQDYLDGFEVSQPAGGALSIRLNPDSLRKIDVRSSRFSTQFGKGSGGLTDLEVQDGDNHLRFNATDFIPTFQNQKRFTLNNWTPRVYFSGPLKRDKVWFNVSHEGELDRNIVKELPAGADTNDVWRTADLARMRMAVAPGNLLTASALVNLLDSEHSGLSPFDPITVSNNLHSSLYLLTLKDQLTLARNTLLEFGAGYHRTKNALVPLGPAPYIFTPTGREGNFYLTNKNVSARTQGFANLYLSPQKWLGTHQFTLGGRVARVVFRGDVNRNEFQFLDANRVLLRQTVFTNAPPFSLNTLESSAFLQDHWSVTPRLLIEAGSRWDHDSFLNRDFYSPRIAGTVMVSRVSETKLSAGVGIYYDRSNLAMASQAFQGRRTDTFFSPLATVIPAAFIADPSRLTMGRFVNWSLAVERRMPWRIYAKLDLLSRHGNKVWAYERQPDGSFLLENNKEDRYEAAQITLRREFKRGYPWQVAYTRSRARSNKSLDFSLDNFTTGNQVGGPLPWDAPNQVTGWGSAPLPSFWKFRKFDLAFSMIYRTGYPFITVNDFGQLVNGPGAFRFPDFFTLNVALEKKFTLKGYRWALRGGIEDITNSENASFVDNNVNSPTFLAFFGQSHRTFNGRIRFLGKQ